MLTFNQSFPIGHELEGGGYEEQYYTPEEYRDPLLYPDAFWEVVGEEEFSPIRHMSEEDWLSWRENPMFEETWALPQLSDTLSMILKRSQWMCLRDKGLP